MLSANARNQASRPIGSRSGLRRVVGAGPSALLVLACLACGSQAANAPHVARAAAPTKAEPTARAGKTKKGAPGSSDRTGPGATSSGATSSEAKGPATTNPDAKGSPAVPGATQQPSTATTSSALGGPGAIGLEAMAPDGRWLAYCQATTDTNGDGALEVATDARGAPVGDVPDVYLSLGDGAERIDELLGFDASGRWLVIRAGERAWLVDSVTRQRTDLSPLAPDLRSDELYELAHRSFSFDARGEQLLVLSHLGKYRYEAHLVALPEPTEGPPDVAQARKVPIPTGETWRVQLAPDGSGLVLHTLLKEPGKAANLQWPAPPRDAPLRRCRGAFAQAGAWAQRGGDVTPLLASIQDPTPRAAPGFVMPIGNAWLRRERTGRLMLVRGSTQKQVASERCGARVLHADPARELFVISCEHYAPDPPKTEQRKKGPPKYRFELYLVAPGFVGDLQADMAATRLDMQPNGSPRLVPLRPGPRSVLVDMERRRLIELRQDDRIVSTHGARALVRRGRKLLVYDAEKDRELPIEGTIETFPEIHVGGRYVFVEPHLVDLVEARVTLRHAGTPLAVTEGGRLLVPTSAADGERWAQGPLRWLGPEPASSQGSVGPAGSLPPAQATPAPDSTHSEL